jgi:hypothetical protein
MEDISKELKVVTRSGRGTIEFPALSALTKPEVVNKLIDRLEKEIGKERVEKFSAYCAKNEGIAELYISKLLKLYARCDFGRCLASYENVVYDALKDTEALFDRHNYQLEAIQEDIRNCIWLHI